MRAVAALAIYVSLVIGAQAEEPRTVQEKTFALDESRTSRGLESLGEARARLERALRKPGADPQHADPQQSVRLAVATADLANAYRAAGDYASAEQLLRESLAQPSCDSQVTGAIRNNLADLLREEGRSDEAEPLFQQALNAPAETGAPDASLRQRSAALIGLADIYRQYGQFDRSFRAWNAALEASRHEQDLRTEAIALRGLGVSWMESGSTARAEPLLRRALRMTEDDPETPREMIAGVRSALGELYRFENKLALAEAEWSRALEIDRAVLGETHPQVAWLMEMLSDVFSARGEFHPAREYATQAAATMRASFGEASMPVASALANRALVEQRAGDPDAAAKDYERAIQIARAYPAHRLLETAMVERYAGLLKALHRGNEAKALLAHDRAGDRIGGRRKDRAGELGAQSFH